MNLSTHKKSEVDLRVAQELKNNQDFIYQTNQTLQSLTQGIVSLSLQQEKLLAKTESRCKEIEIGFENLKEIVDEVCHECIQNIGDILTKLDAFCLEIREKFDSFSKDYVKHDDFERAIDIQTGKNIAFDIDISRLQDDIKISTHNSKSLLKQSIDGLRKDLTPVVPEVDPLKVEIDEKFKVLKVDFEGFFKEIFLMKKAIVYEQKKIENIYTLIERLQAGKK